MITNYGRELILNTLEESLYNNILYNTTCPVCGNKITIVNKYRSILDYNIVYFYYNFMCCKCEVNVYLEGFVDVYEENYDKQFNVVKKVKYE